LSPHPCAKGARLFLSSLLCAKGASFSFSYLIYREKLTRDSSMQFSRKEIELKDVILKHCFGVKRFEAKQLQFRSVFGL